MVPFRQLDRAFAVRKGTSVRLWPKAAVSSIRRARQLSGDKQPSLGPARDG
jgi:hypothetical protein